MPNRVAAIGISAKAARFGAKKVEAGFGSKSMYFGTRVSVHATAILLLAAMAMPALASLTPDQTSIDLGVADSVGFAQAQLVVTNSGTSRFHGEVSISDDHFWLQRTDCNLPMGINPGATCTLFLRFSGSDPCVYHANLQIENKAAPSPAEYLYISLSGAGASGSPDCTTAQLTDPGRWRYVEGPWVGTSGDAGSILAVADLGGDGEMDVIIYVSTYSTQPFPQALWHEERVDQVYVYTLTKDGNYIETTKRWFGVSPVLMPGLIYAYVGDLNGDGKDDVAFAATNEDGRPMLDPGTGEHLWYTRNFAFMSTSTDTYNVVPLTDLRQTAYSISGGDINDDGHIDLWVCGPFLLINDGAGNFTYQDFTATNLPTSNSFGNLCPAAMADLDGDGKVDLAVGRITDGRVAIFKNLGSQFAYIGEVLAFPGVRDANAGTYTVDFGFTTGILEGITQVIAVDVDGDGKKDLVAYAGGGLNGQSFFAPTSGFRVLRNLGSLNFQSLAGPWDLTQIGQSLGTEVLPLNHAGGIDAVMRTQNSTAPLHRMQVNGDGHGGFAFENVLTFPTLAGFSGRAPGAIQIADMDGDGRLDVVANTSGPTQGHRGIYLSRASHVQLGDDVIFRSSFE